MSEQTHSYVTWLPKLFPEQGKWTEEDYSSLPETSRIIELSQGMIIMSPYPTPKHQIISDNLQNGLSNFVRAGKLGRVMSAPTSIRLWENKIRGPDMLFLRTEHLDQIGRQWVEAPCDWIAEIISPRSRKIDTEDKLVEYAQAGIYEYWLLDPKRETIQVYVLTEGTYTLHSTYKRGDIAKAQTIPGFEIAVSEVFDA